MTKYFLLSAFLVFTASTHATRATNPTSIECLILVPAAPNTSDCRSFTSVLCIDPTNSAKWGSLPNCTVDLGACLTAAQDALPKTTVGGHAYPIGVIDIRAMANSNPTQSTTFSPSPLVSIVGPGMSQLQITCTMNADCWIVRDSFWQEKFGSPIGGFTLIGQGGANPNANGIHTGDLVRARFYDIAIDNFLGSAPNGGSCLWVDNQKGWFERNRLDLIDLGEHFSSNGAVTSEGCHKVVRFTANGGGAISFGYNEWSRLGMSIVAGSVGFSLESGSLYNNFIGGSANMQPNATLFFVATSSLSTGNIAAFHAECTGCRTSTTGFAGPAVGNFEYTGYFKEDNEITDADNPGVVLGGGNRGGTPVLYGTPYNPAGGRGSSITTSMYLGVAGAPKAGISLVGAWLLRPTVVPTRFVMGPTINLFYNGSNFQLNADGGGNNGGGAMLGDTTGTLYFPCISSNRTSGSPQIVAPANLLSATCLKLTPALTSLNTPITVNGSSQINKIYRLSGLQLNSPFTAISAPGCQEQTVIVAGALTTGTASVQPTSNIGPNFYWSAWVSSPDTVSIRVCAFTPGTPANVPWNVTVIQ
jgi:hypothetical protein